MSFGSLLYRHSPAQAVTNRGRAASITASLHCALDTLHYNISPIHSLDLGGKFGAVLKREEGSLETVIHPVVS